MSLSVESVLAASQAWSWVPDDALTVSTGDYLLIRFPDYFEHPLELTRFSPAGPVEEAMAAALDRARAFGLPDLYWLTAADGPAAVPDLLAARGATLDMTLDVLARDLRPDSPAGAVGPASPAGPLIPGARRRSRAWNCAG